MKFLTRSEHIYEIIMSNHKKPTLYFTLGYPGSGKTHFSMQFAKHQNLFHLNSDRLRLEMFEVPTYTVPEHRAVFQTMDYIAGELLDKGISVMYDANSNKKVHREAKYALANLHNARAILLWFQTPLEVALERISNRGDGKNKYFRNISPGTLYRLKAELEEPQDDEPFVVIDGTLPYSEQVKVLLSD
jgi:predicted kinase